MAFRHPDWTGPLKRSYSHMAPPGSRIIFREFRRLHPFGPPMTADQPTELIDFLAVKFGGTDGRFDALEARFERLEHRFDGLEKRFDGLDKRVVRVEVSL
jgi:hypothetical protein